MKESEENKNKNNFRTQEMVVKIRTFVAAVQKKTAGMDVARRKELRQKGGMKLMGMMSSRGKQTRGK